MLNAVDDGYGGLEHRASTALIAARRDLPRRGANGTPGDGYVTLLGLISHEYFHTWNVKRLQAGGVRALRLHARELHASCSGSSRASPSYYDDLLLLRAGLIDEARYLKLLAKTINQVLQHAGARGADRGAGELRRLGQVLPQDENTPNATVSYYTKGALVALCST